MDYKLEGWLASTLQTCLLCQVHFSQSADPQTRFEYMRFAQRLEPIEPNEALYTLHMPMSSFLDTSFSLMPANLNVDPHLEKTR